ncbi:helix-turn-helix domain-containing protein [Streptomyces sp. SPB074]|uniref:helix-turn-helix domain-containing protein n=1 Tax=Streptomyces sp. (strain SPB074) TaxID=465543 RepID=UPI00017FE9AE|nr:helix-turn-helix domain-containing protein [Streptomyces sp. SPB074]EDY43599.1 excisionase family DNA binding domain-containing protein [Streptomyces sp. SPB074]
MASGGSNRLLTPNQVADVLAIPKRTLYAKWREWGIPARRVGKHLRFRERDLALWIEQHPYV